MLSTAMHRLTNGDLHGMDAGELREHLTHYLAARPEILADLYVARVVEHLEAVTGIDGALILGEIVSDAKALR